VRRGSARRRESLAPGRPELHNAAATAAAAMVVIAETEVETEAVHARVEEVVEIEAEV
jgi:hypothetical protein